VIDMSLVRVGSNSKFADGWDAAFGGGKKKSKAGKTAKPAKASKKKTASPKKASKKKSKK
jgi:hypothetical protein